VILVDTSIWIRHYRASDRVLEELLSEGQVLSHVYVRGELACGNLKDREYTLRLHQLLPQAVPVKDEEVIAFIGMRNLAGRGLGWVDMHLLASAVLTPDAALWTHDDRLATVAAEMSVRF